MTPERWKSFSLPGRILRVSNEVSRARSALRKGSLDSARKAYFRALELFDLTIATLEAPRPAQERGFSLWRELLAQEAAAESPSLERNLALLKALLLLTPHSTAQIPQPLPVEKLGGRVGGEAKDRYNGARSESVCAPGRELCPCLRTSSCPCHPCPAGGALGIPKSRRELLKAAASAAAGALALRPGGAFSAESSPRFEPEYARGLEEVLIVYDQVAPDYLFREVVEILGCLPSGCTVRFLVSREKEARLRSQLAERGLRAHVHPVDASELWGDWGRDIFQVSWRDGRTVLLVPYAKTARTRGQLTRGYEVLRALWAPSRDVRLVPLSFEGGNLAYDRIGRDRVLFAGSSVLHDSDALYRVWFGQGLEPQKCLDMLRESFSVDRVVVLGRRKNGSFLRQASLLFHIDLACAIVAEGSAVVGTFEGPVDPDELRREIREELELYVLNEAERRRVQELLEKKGIKAEIPGGPESLEKAVESAVSSETEKLREAEEELEAIRRIFQDLGYRIRSIPADWRAVRRTQSYANVLLSRERLVMPIFPKHGSAKARTVYARGGREIIEMARIPEPEDYALEGNNLRAYRLYRELFRDVRVVKDAFFTAGGSVHCVVGAIG